MNVLVTGGAGYIGTALVYRLAARDEVTQVVIYDNLIRNNHSMFIGQSDLQSNKIKFVLGDILDTRKLKKEVDVADIVFHLAAKVTTPFADNNPHEFDQVNNWGTAELTYLIENSTVSKFIYASSVSVYGAAKEVANIDAELNPKTFYSISKMHGERHIERLKDSSVQLFNLRLGNVYGHSKSMRFDSVINKFAFEANFTNRIKIYGTGNQIRSFIQIDRLSDMLTNIALTDIQPDTYNLVENTFSIEEIVSELKQIYPNLEMMFVNQSVKMRSLNVKPDVRLANVNLPAQDVLKEDLKRFVANFSF